MSINKDDQFDDQVDDRFDEYEGLDLTSEPSTNKSSDSKPSSSADSPTSGLKNVQVHFRCCKVYWRFPIPADILSGVKQSWFVHCPRCGSKVQLP